MRPEETLQAKQKQMLVWRSYSKKARWCLPLVKGEPKFALVQMEEPELRSQANV